MTYTVSVYGRGNEFCIGSISKETWDYIQEHFDGDSGEYLEALENGDIPDEHMLAPDQYSFYECDDLHHHDACPSTYYTITVEDEDGHEVFSFNNEDAEKKGVQIETNAYSYEYVGDDFASKKHKEVIVDDINGIDMKAMRKYLTNLKEENYVTVIHNKVRYESKLNVLCRELGIRTELLYIHGHMSKKHIGKKKIVSFKSNNEPTYRRVS